MSATATEKPSTPPQPKPPLPALNSTQYAPPQVAVGEAIHWWPDGHKSGVSTPGFVVVVGSRTLAIALIVEGQRTIVYKDGVRHIDDPEVLRPEFEGSGAWEYCQMRKEVNEIKAELEKFRAALL